MNFSVIMICVVSLIGSFPASADRVSERFSVSPEGIIIDSETRLQWMVGPDMDFTWFDARSWINELEGNWRMPSKYELLDLFNAGVDIYHWGPFDNNGKYVWAFDIQSNDLSFLFSFVPDYDFLERHYSEDPIGIRVFAVYSPPIRRRLVLRTSRSWNQFDFPLFPRYSG
ncbi:MAG: hypothetical protein K8R76_00080 [Candidatus Aegiribacteria sp.]|nr:hypothetical protein [Candidatus Aegiribacteria sp.]